MKTRLVFWCLIVGFLSLIAYAAQLSDTQQPKDVAYQWSSSVAGGIEYAIALGIVFLLTIGLNRRVFLAFRRPRSWWRAAGIAVLVIVCVFVVSAIVAPFGNPEKEQGLIPDHWDSSRAAQFAAFAVIVVIVAPIVEELMFRGVGYGLLVQYGSTAAILLVGLAFALVHGLVAGFPVIFTFGVGLAFLRSRTDSIYPCMLLHASFNAMGLAIGIAG